MRKRMKFAMCEQANAPADACISLLKHTPCSDLALSMADKPDNDLSLELQFLPDWVQDGAGTNKYAGHSGEDRQSGGRRGFGREGRRPPRGGDRRDRSRQGEGRKKEFREKGRPRVNRQNAPRDKRGSKPRRPQAPQLDIKVDFVPDTQGVESIAKEIRLTGRAYPLFQIALLVLDRPARFMVNLRAIKKPGGEVAQRLFACKLDDTVWLTQEQGLRHTLDRHFDQFYSTNKIEVDAPKGNFTFVAQCGVTSEYLGPPNHHDYQKKLVSFHAERMSRMPFEKFKSRIRILKEEEAINAWIEQSKWKTEFVTLQVDEELTFNNQEEVEAHFRLSHLASAVEEVQTHSLSGTVAKELRDPRNLAEFLRDQWHRQKHFPMQVATHLSKIFSGMGLQFFKKDKKVTHVSVAKPHYLDVEVEPVSGGIKKVIQFIEATSDCTRRQILENLGGLEHVEPKEGENPPPLPEQTEEQKQLISDIHWLIHQGHVLEFSNGIIETAKKPRKQAEAKPGAKEDVKEDLEEESTSHEKAALKHQESESTEAVEETVVEEFKD